MHPDRIVRSLRRTEFVVTMKTGQTWRGVLTEADEHTLTLMAVTEIAHDGTVTQADGQIFLPRSDVAYMQRA
jgi:small nuclear ribonucleoprotein (snRNP)-like protein